jgi:hypothetical protein
LTADCDSGGLAELVASLARVEILLAAIATRRELVTVTRQEAADRMSISLDSFEKFVQPHLRLLREGRLRLVPVTEIERFVRERQAFAR